MEVTFNSGEAVELPANALSTFVARLEFATVYGLEIEESGELEDSSVAFLNVNGWCQFHQAGRIGLCVMVVGRDVAGAILWACCLMARRESEDTLEMMESLMIPLAVLGKTTRVQIRVDGMVFGENPGADAEPRTAF